MTRRGQRSRQEADLAWEVALKILNYLAEHPNAADTVEGIVQWWLLEREIVEEEEKVGQALDLLVRKGLLVSVQAADARRHYHLNAKQIEEIKKLIRKGKKRRA